MRRVIRDHALFPKSLFFCRYGGDKLNGRRPKRDVLAKGHYAIEREKRKTLRNIFLAYCMWVGRSGAYLLVVRIVAVVPFET